MKEELLVVFPHHATFIDQDLQLLRDEFSTSSLIYSHRKDRFRLLRRIGRARVALGWFVLGYAYAMVRLGPLFGTKIVLIPAGWDVEHVPEIGYGIMSSARQRRRTAFALSRADRVLAVSEFTKSRVLHWAPESRPEVLYHGFPEQSEGSQFREDRVVTVASVDTGTWRLKGLETLLQAAEQLPELQFDIVGKVSRDPLTLSNLRPGNVRFHGWLPQPELIRLFARSKVYAQLSYVESFGCSLAEAMSCGCYPVTTDRGALPEVAGEVGTFVPYGDVMATVAAIRRGMERSPSRPAKERIASRFSLAKRRERLVRIVRELLDGPSACAGESHF